MVSKEDFIRLLMSGSSDDDEDTPRRPKRTTILLEAQILTLRELAAAYAAGNIYKVGDLITPRRGVNLRHAGAPHMIVEILEPPIRKGESQKHSHGAVDFWARLDIRVVSFYGDYVVPHVMESWQVERWVEGMTIVDD